MYQERTETSDAQIPPAKGLPQHLNSAEIKLLKKVAHDILLSQIPSLSDNGPGQERALRILFEKNLTILSKDIEKKPENIELYQKRALVNFYLANFEDTIKDLEELSAGNNKSLQADAMIIKTHISILQGNFKEAIDSSNQGITVVSSGKKEQLQIINLLCQIVNGVASNDSIEQFTKKNIAETNPLAQQLAIYFKARSFIAQNNITQALEAFEKISLTSKSVVHVLALQELRKLLAKDINEITKVAIVELERKLSTLCLPKVNYSKGGLENKEIGKGAQEQVDNNISSAVFDVQSNIPELAKYFATSIKEIRVESNIDQYFKKLTKNNSTGKLAFSLVTYDPKTQKINSELIIRQDIAQNEYVQLIGHLVHEACHVKQDIRRIKEGINAPLSEKEKELPVYKESILHLRTLLENWKVTNTSAVLIRSLEEEIQRAVVKYNDYNKMK